MSGLHRTAERGARGSQTAETNAGEIVRMTIQRFILNSDGSVSEEPDLLRWMEFLDQNNPLLAHDRLPGAVHVSTVFCGVNRNYASGPPILFQSTILGGPHNGYLERYSSKAEAMSGHERAVRIAQGKAGVA
jgi:hypothetical protein